MGSSTRPMTWEKRFANALTPLMQAIDELELFLAGQRVDAKALHTTRLAIEEMGTNVLKYGFDDRAEHWITLRAQCAGSEIELRLTDDGHPFDPCARIDPNSEATLEERTPGGWGISLVRRLVKKMHYQRRDHLNILTLCIERTEGAG